MVNKQIWPDEVQPVEKLEFEHIESKYVKVVVARIVLVYLILMGCAALLLTSDLNHATTIFVVAEIVLALAFLFNVAMSTKIFDFKGYAFRHRDISYRSGLFFPKVITVPFNKVQQVTVRTNILSRPFGLYYVDVTNGTQNSAGRITIPGLTLDRARQIEAVIISNADLADKTDDTQNSACAND